jgi:hypothetical protein
MLPCLGVAIQGVLEMQQVRLVPLPRALALDLTMKSSLYVIIMVVAGLISVASSDLNAKSDGMLSVERRVTGCFL